MPEDPGVKPGEGEICGGEGSTVFHPNEPFSPGELIFITCRSIAIPGDLPATPGGWQP